MSANPETLIVTSLLVSGGLAAAGQASTGTVHVARLAVGVTVAGIALGTMALFSGQLAAAFAVLLLVASLLTNGAALTSLATSLGGPTP